MSIKWCVPAFAALAVASACGGDQNEYATTSGPLGPALLPDIVEEVSHLGIQNKMQREILRFSTTHWNQGAGPLQIRGGTETGPCPPELSDQGTICTFAKQEILDARGNVVEVHDAGVALFHEEHNHWHQNDVARFGLRRGTLDGPVVTTNNKVTFCLVDYEFDKHFVGGTRKRAYFECNADLQGVSVGWGDEYHHSTPLQELDITGLPAGVYYLTHEANPAGNWLESNITNNDSWVKISLTRTGSNPEVRELERPPCPVLSGPDYQVLCGNTSNK